MNDAKRFEQERENLNKVVMKYADIKIKRFFVCYFCCFLKSF